MITIRRARANDHDALRAIDLASKSPLNSPGDTAADTDIDADPFADADPSDHLVAELDGRVVGYVLVELASPLRSNRHVAIINGLAVHPDAGRQGIGRRLVDQAVADAADRGIRKLRLRVLSTNPAAIALYRSAGFVLEGTLHAEFHIDGHEVDDHLMALHLT